MSPDQQQSTTVQIIGDEHRNNRWTDRHGDLWRWYSDGPGRRGGWQYLNCGDPYARWVFGGMHIPDCGPYVSIGEWVPHEHVWRTYSTTMCDGDRSRMSVECACGARDVIVEDPDSVNLAGIYAALSPAPISIAEQAKRRHIAELERTIDRIRAAINETNPYALDRDEFAAVLERLGNILSGDA